MENLYVEKQAKTFDICPCCGAKSIEHSATNECHHCGARAVGAPLTPPENLLPSYWRAFGAGAGGASLLAVFLILTLAAWFANKSLSFGFWDFVAAGETAAWRLKWFSLPVALLMLYASCRAARIVRNDPARFTGLRLARFGITASAAFALAVALLIGITVPARLQQRALAQRAAREATGYALLNRLLAYKVHFGTFPKDTNDLKELKKIKSFANDDTLDALIVKLKDAKYEPTTDIATTLAPNDAKSRGMRATTPDRLRQISISVINSERIDDVPGEAFPFTSFKLTIPGEEGLFGKEDDIELTEDGFASSSASAISKIRASKQSVPVKSRRAR